MTMIWNGSAWVNQVAPLKKPEKAKADIKETPTETKFKKPKAAKVGKVVPTKVGKVKKK